MPSGAAGDSDAVSLAYPKVFLWAGLCVVLDGEFVPRVSLHNGVGD